MARRSSLINMPSDLLNRDFEDMTDPPLADRLRAFELRLSEESCTGPPFMDDDEPLKIGSCVFLSNSRRMCAPCRLRLHFHHCIHYAENYEGGPGEIPRKYANS